MTREDVIPYAMVDDLPTLAWAANLGTIELHVPLWHVGRRRKLPARPGPHGLRPRPGRGNLHRRVLRGGRLRHGGARPAGNRVLRQDQRIEGPAALCSRRAEDDVGQPPRPGARDRPQTGVRSPGPGRLQHAQVVAPRPGPHRLEPEPLGQDDRRGLLGPGHADTDRVDTGHARPRCTRCATKTRSPASFASRPTTCCGESTSTAISLPPSDCADRRNPHKRGKGCGGQRSLASEAPANRADATSGDREPAKSRT